MRGKLGLLTPLALLCMLSLLFALAACEGEQGAQGVAGADGTDADVLCTEQCHTDDASALQDWILSFQQETEASGHAHAESFVRRDADCSGCHTTEGYQYRVANGTTIAIANSSRISCFACHAPHSNENFNMRKQGATDWIIGAGSYDKGNSNTCAMCHQGNEADPAIAVADTITNKRWGPHHGPQSNMLAGHGAYDFGTPISATHPHNGAGVPNGCVDCHMSAQPEDGMAGGHSFQMMFEYHGSFSVNDTGCGCHAGQNLNAKLTAAQTAYENAVRQLGGDLVTLGWIDTDTIYVAVPSDVIDADGRGAIWNYRMLLEESSEGVHNPTYINGVITATQAYVNTQLPQ
jgi:hypothetical protein